jgi:hypothetical protein
MNDDERPSAARMSTDRDPKVRIERVGRWPLAKLRQRQVGYSCSAPSRSLSYPISTPRVQQLAGRLGPAVVERRLGSSLAWLGGRSASSVASLRKII